MYKRLNILGAMAVLLLNSICTASLSCPALLKSTDVTKIDLNYDKTKLRKPELISISEKNRISLKQYSKYIIEDPNGIKMHARKQYLKSCYLCSSQMAIEHKLKRNQMVPKDSLLLTGPFIGSIAQDRYNDPKNTSPISELVNSGTFETFHALNNKKAYYIKNSEIKKIGTAEDILQLEELFLEAFAEKQTYSFNNKNLHEYLRDQFNLNDIMPLAFQDYIKTLTGININISSLKVHHLKYTNIMSPVSDENSYLDGSVSTLSQVTVKQVKEQHYKALRPDIFKNNIVYKKNNINLKEKVISFAVENLESGKVIRAALKTGVFKSTHSVVLTNLVVHQDTGRLIGFVYLNSHSDRFGESGYGFISAAEAAEYIYSLITLDDIIL